MAVSGFEGFEKRLELDFSWVDPISAPLGLRLVDFELLEQMLAHVQCTVVSALANAHFDAYVLSESSMFIYPTRVIIKTCGTTQLLKSVCPLILLAAGLGLMVCRCRYTRGSFLFPELQPFPHRSFEDEVLYLEDCLPSWLCERKSSVMRPTNMAGHYWHVFAATGPSRSWQFHDDGSYTVEVCMTELDRVCANKFYHTSEAQECSLAKAMTQATGIGDINPRALVCDFAFEPCGYSMNGIDTERYSTIHVTPEAGFSYASYECIGNVHGDGDEITRILMKVVKVFCPRSMSISITGESEELSDVVKSTLQALGLESWDRSTDQFPGYGTVVFQTFRDSQSGGNGARTDSASRKRSVE
ncbi:hypothetical protein MLD38_016883 [Melastoma candidum]|uniref:Uncharacterized protein n=1 Tax=Melastoma candidum TaxID=119954 RepID=A0ACB9QNW2_9MYRT|nr:hypothetical protein MLD38_016883 [Melastoma candidum]